MPALASEAAVSSTLARDRQYTMPASPAWRWVMKADEGSQDYKDAVDWFRQLPVWLEIPGLRVVHACWHEPSRTNLKPYLDSRNCLTEEGLQEAHRRGSAAYLAAEVLMKGPEQRLPPGMSFLDKGGHKRHDVRLRWWAPLLVALAVQVPRQERVRDLRDP